MKNYERWLWIDLIGFDNKKPDLGVKQFLGNLGFIPDAVSLFICDPDFVHSFKANEKNRIFPESYCSYDAHHRNTERKRQRWTKLQLEGLIRELRKKSVKVFFSVFASSTMSNDDHLAYLKLKKRPVWMDNHPEIFNIQYSGEQSSSICMYKRLADGSYYEDFFVQQLGALMKEYGFDGFHGADGYAPPSVAISAADFSGDMFEQFVDSEQITVPADIRIKCGVNPESISRRAAWIWKNKRKEWIEFHAKRSGRFWKKIIKTLHAMRKEVVLNSTWTRDPFESKYRFGIDYKILADAGVDAFIVESSAGAMELMGEKSPRPVFDRMAMIMLIKALVPGTRLILMNAFNDTNEQWSTLRHAPLLLETEVYSLANVFWYDAKTRLKRCLSGILACLAAGITKTEWAWLKKRWDLGFATDPKNISGATLIVSGNLFAGEIDNYLKTRKWSVHKILYHLIARGARVYAVSDVLNIGRIKGPILIIQPHLFSKSELEKALSYRGGPVVLIGSEPINAGAIPSGGSKTKTGWFCSVYQSGRKPGKGASVADHWLPGNENNNDAGRDAVVSTGNEHLISWVDDLPGEKVPDGFLDKCAQVIGSVSDGGAEVIEGREDVNIMSVGIKKGLIRVFLWNNKNVYFTPKIDVGADIKSARVITEFPSLHVHWARKSDFRDRADFYKGSIFKVIIPPKGMTVLDIDLE